MFGFGDRKKFNGSVDLKLRNEYGIETRSNPKFPGALAILKLLDHAWDAQMTVEAAGMYVATLYYGGLIKEGFGETDEAVRLGSAYREVSNRDFLAGKIVKNRFDGFRAAVETVKAKRSG